MIPLSILCLQSLTLRELRGLNSIIHKKGFELCLACDEYSKKSVAIAAAAVDRIFKKLRISNSVSYWGGFASRPCVWDDHVGDIFDHYSWRDATGISRERPRLLQNIQPCAAQPRITKNDPVSHVSKQRSPGGRGM